MDSSITASIFGNKAFSFLATPAARRKPNPTTKNPSLVVCRTSMFHVYACNSRFTTNPNLGIMKGAIFLAHCSTGPNTDSKNSIDQNSIVEPNLDSDFPKTSQPPISSQTLSPPNSSSSRGLVFHLGPKDSWDSGEIGSPVVKRYLSYEEERWYMWYHGRPSGNPALDSIGLAVSSNGIHWERGVGAVKSSGDVGLVLNCSKDWWAFDTESIRPSEVVVMSSSKVRANSAVYWLYYTGYTSEKVDILDNFLQFSLNNPEMVSNSDNEIGRDGNVSKVFKSFPGLAISQDGRHWARIEGEHHTGALFDVGSDGDWDSMFIASPKVVFHGSGDLRMYYHSFDVKEGIFTIGFARSRDGIRWVKLGKIIGGGENGAFDECGLKNAHVVRNREGGNYAMVYEGIAADGGTSIGLAVSSDGLRDWRRLQDEAVLKQSKENGWDNKGVGSPCLVHMDGDADQWRLYYRGIGEKGRTGIGMAVSKGSDIGSFIRWPGFHL